MFFLTYRRFMPMVQKPADDVLNRIFDLAERQFFYCRVNQHDSIFFFFHAQLPVESVLIDPVGFPHQPANPVAVHCFFKFLLRHTHRHLYRVGSLWVNLQRQPYQPKRILGKGMPLRKKPLNGFPAAKSFRFGKREIWHGGRLTRWTVDGRQQTGRPPSTIYRPPIKKTRLKVMEFFKGCVLEHVQISHL